MNNQISEETTYDHKDQIDNVSSGISIESASYIENSNLNEAKDSLKENEDDYTPELFSESQSYQSDDALEPYKDENRDSQELFDQDINEEEDFEIPAFLRKQKF